MQRFRCNLFLIPKNMRNHKEGTLKAGRKLAPRASTARRNRKGGALKAQLHIARGETPGNGIRPTIPAPCKGSYINIEGCNLAIEGCSCPYRAQFLYLRVYPRRCPGLMVVAPSGCGMPQIYTQNTTNTKLMGLPSERKSTRRLR